jgi:Rhodanese-like domain
MDRITVAELRKLIDDGQEIVILDVRPKETRAQEGTIPSAVSAHPADTDPALKTYPREMEIVDNVAYGNHGRPAHC